MNKRAKILIVDDDAGLRQALTLLLVLLSGEACEGNRRFSLRVPTPEKLPQFLDLAVGKGVHRVHDDRLRALSGAGTQHEVHDVGERTGRVGVRRHRPLRHRFVAVGEEVGLLGDREHEQALLRIGAEGRQLPSSRWTMSGAKAGTQTAMYSAPSGVK